MSNPLVTYCQAGVRAAHLAFALELLSPEPLSFQGVLAYISIFIALLSCTKLDVAGDKAAHIRVYDESMAEWGNEAGDKCPVLV